MTTFHAGSPEDQAEALRELARNALARYDGQFSEPELVKYRENAIFSACDERGERFAVRVHRPHYHSDEALASELSWMRALADEGLPVPSLRLNRDGQAITLSSAPRVPEMRRVNLLGWVDGTPLSSMEESGVLSEEEHAALYRRIGTLMARLHDHGTRWARPDGFERHDWFSDALVGEEPLWGRFWDLPGLGERQRTLLVRARQEGLRVLAHHPRSARNSGLIHADLIADNLMIDGETVRPIDFDDAGFGWHMFDIATTLYFLGGRPNAQRLRDALIQGYRQVRPLPETELLLLPLFLMLRGTSYLGWVGSRSETETARELAPFLIQQACATCEEYWEWKSVNRKLASVG